MNIYDVLVVGGGPAGFTTAIMLKRLKPDLSIALVRREEKVLIPCAIPYLFYSIDSIDKNVISDDLLVKLGIDVFVDEVKSINLSSRIAKTLTGKEIEFKKLVLAVGSKPKKLGVEGENLGNVFHIVKDYKYLKNVVDVVKSSTNVVIVGGGFVGVEVADELSKAGKNVTIVEVLPHLLAKNFDKDIAFFAEEELRKRGVVIKTNATVTKIIGNGKVGKVKLSTGEEIPADVVIVAVGVEPNNELAKALGLEIGLHGGILVDNCRRTSNPVVYAVGDCVERQDIITGRYTLVQLASAAVADARVAAISIATNAVCRYEGFVGAFTTKVGDTVLAVAGITESRAREEGLDYVVGVGEAIDRHPIVLPGGRYTKLKLIVSRATGEIIGAQAVGGPSTAELINMVSTLIQSRATVVDTLMLQVATHPWLTPSPIAYTLHTAALNVFTKLR